MNNPKPVIKILRILFGLNCSWYCQKAIDFFSFLFSANDLNLQFFHPLLIMNFNITE